MPCRSVSSHFPFLFLFFVSFKLKLACRTASHLSTAVALFQRLDSVRPIHDRTSSAHHEGLVAQAGAVLDATFRRSLAGSPESSECNARLANAGKN